MRSNHGYGDLLLKQVLSGAIFSRRQGREHKLETSAYLLRNGNHKLKCKGNLPVRSYLAVA